MNLHCDSPSEFSNCRGMATMSHNLKARKASPKAEHEGPSLVSWMLGSD